MVIVERDREIAMLKQEIADMKNANINKDERLRALEDRYK